MSARPSPTAAKHAARLLAGLVILVPLPGLADEGWTVDFSAELGTESRIFFDGAQFAGQEDARVTGSLFGESELVAEFDGGDQRLTLVPFGRLDSHDEQRTHFDLREAHYRYLAADWDVLVGLGKQFWGKTESRHLVDIINQTDLVEAADGEEKLGQPMVNGNYYSAWGDLALFVLPGFRERTFPGEAGRLRGPLPVETDDPVYNSNLGQAHVDLAARYATFIGDWDFGLSQFWGTGREPRLLPEQRGARTVLVPHYDIIDQTGLDVQYTSGPWLLKAEVIQRGGQGRRFFAGVAGFEYTFFDMGGSGLDLGLLSEYLYDGRDANAPATPFEDDVFVGARLALNDTASTEMLAGAIIDRTTAATVMSVEAERRVGQAYKAEFEGQVYVHAPDGDPFVAFRRDHHMTLRLTRFF